MNRPRLHHDALGTRLLEIASQVISTSGAAALTVRDVAHRAGTSTSAVYALFGSRDALVAAVGDEAFRRFAAHLGAVPRTRDPRADLLALGAVYRESAVGDPHLYRVMFDVSGTGARGDDDDAPPIARPPFTVLRDAVLRVLVDAGLDRSEADADALERALVLWGFVHGLVGLELGGLVPGDDADRAERYVRALGTAGTAVMATPWSVSDGGARLGPRR